MKAALKPHGYIWATLALFAGSWAIHAAMSESWAEFVRSTAENWQSEFIQLVWQVWGLSWLLSRGSPQSKDEAARLERKVDDLLSHARRNTGALYREELRR